jgi:L-histidine Nalpha-methyltransferase / hercynylcysteine S-oxide synthase
MAGLRCVLSLIISNDTHCYLLECPAVAFGPVNATPTFIPKAQGVPVTSLGNVPTWDEWENLWKIWDLVTLQMIPKEMLHQKPIDLRHKCLFYIGHIPTCVLSPLPRSGHLFRTFRFLDMLLCKAIGGTACEPQHFWKIFEVRLIIWKRRRISLLLRYSEELILTLTTPTIVMSVLFIVY